MIRLLDTLSFLLQWGYVFVIFRMLHVFLPLRKGRILRLAAFVAAGYLFNAIIYPNDFAGLFGAFLGSFVYIGLFHREHWAKKLTAVLVFYPAFIAVNFLMQDIGSRCFFSVSSIQAESPLTWTREQLLLSTTFYTLSQVFRLLFWLLSWKMMEKYLRKAVFHLTARMWFMVDILMLAPFLAVSTMIYFEQENWLLVYLICGSSLFSSFGCMYLASYICASVETSFYAQELERKQSYYRERMKEEERVRSVYHDMKNHLLVLERQMQTPETAGMIRKLQQEVAAYEDYVHTGSDILDIILKEKAAAAREKHMELSVTADLGGMDFLEPLDISTIFGNGLDNAMEASEKLPREERVILVKAGRVQNFFSVLMENNCQAEEEAPGKGTTKEDAFFHGFGISNMRKAAEKYGGQLHSRCENGKFQLKILIPVPPGAFGEAAR